MHRISELLNEILRYSFLGKREKVEWFEEMNAHLLETVEDLRSKGFSEELAINRAIKRFGTAKEIRERLTKEMYGFRVNSIFLFAAVGIFLLLSFLIIRIIHNRYDIHTRFMELLPVVIMTLTVMSLCLIFTRKRIDRVCLLLTPLLFILGYMQVYLEFLVHSFGGRIDFLLFERLFFSGVFDQQYDSSFILHSFNFSLIWIGNVFLVGYSILLFTICRNRIISILPFLWSIIYTILHMGMIGTSGNRLVSHVTAGYVYFSQGNQYRVLDIVINLVIMLCLNTFFAFLEKRNRNRLPKLTV